MKLRVILCVILIEIFITQVPEPIDSKFTLEVLPSPIGDYIVDSKGRTLYVFNKDCYDECAVQYPPYIIANNSTLSVGNTKLIGSYLGNATRIDLKKAVTYNKYVLYYYVDDKLPGEINSQNKKNFGGDWTVFTPSGQKNLNDLVSANLQIMKIGNISYIADNRGLALYTFNKDQPNKSNCLNECELVLPPLTINTDKPTGGKETNSALISTFKKKDGVYMITYNNWPLYYYTKDKIPGQIAGQSIAEQGGVLYLISPSGEILKPNSGILIGVKFGVICLILFLILI